jgi:hypothetical protein
MSYDRLEDTRIKLGVYLMVQLRGPKSIPVPVRVVAQMQKKPSDWWIAYQMTKGSFRLGRRHILTLCTVARLPTKHDQEKLTAFKQNLAEAWPAITAQRKATRLRLYYCRISKLPTPPHPTI